MKNARLVSFLAFGIQASVLNAAPWVSAEYFLPQRSVFTAIGYDLSPASAVGQTFLAKISGHLDSITLSFDATAQVDPIQVSLFSVSSNLPDTVLATAFLSSIADGENVVSFFSQNIPIAEGVTYAIVVSASPRPEPQCFINGGGTTNMDPNYLEGVSLWRDADQNWAPPPSGADRDYFFRVTVLQQPCLGISSIFGRYIFYNNSYYDTPGTFGQNPCDIFWSPKVSSAGTIGGPYAAGTPCSDDTAIASNVIALLPGKVPIIPTAGHSSTANYSSYLLGINGIIVDIDHGLCPALPVGALTADQISSTFEFAQTTGLSTGRTVTSAFSSGRTPTSVTIAPHPSRRRTDRITIIFADNTSNNSSWMRTRILPGGVINNLTPLPGGDLDRFYFGLAKAEGMSVNPNLTYALVTTQDQNDCKAPNGHLTINRALIDDPYDYNRDSLVNSIDQNAPKAPNTTNTITCLQLSGTAP